MSMDSRRGDSSIPFYSVRSPLEDATNARALRPINLGTAVRHALRYDGTCDLSPGLRSCCVIALVPLRVSLSLSLAMWAPKRDLCHFVGKTTKSPKEKKAFPSPVCVCVWTFEWPTWDMACERELTSGSTNWAIFRSANGLKVLQLSPYIFGRSDSRAAIILAFYQPKFKGFSFGFPLKDLWPANCARILVSRL